MSTPIKMPQMGESVVEGTVTRWLKTPGDRVEKLEPILEVSTDKIDTELPAPVSGTLIEISVREGETVDAGTIIGYIGSEDEIVVADTPSPIIPPDIVDSDQSNSGRGESALTSEASPAVEYAEIRDRPSGRDFISPVVARMAAEHQIDLEQISGTGLGGRVTKKDLLNHLATLPGKLPERDGQAAARSPQEVTTAEQKAPPQYSSSPVSLADEAVLHPLTTIRRAIAQHMVQSKATSPHVTTIFEADMTRVVQHRERYKEMYRRRGVALNYTAYFVAASASALRREPLINSRFTDEGIVQFQRIHVGFAVAIDDGLIVPVLFDADEKNLQGIARGVQDLAAKARAGQLGPDEIRGGTFTVSNHGVGGSLIGTPIINQPQAGILGVGAIVKRPTVRSDETSLLPSAEDAIVIRPMCYLNFTFDHRILDGAVADRFVTRIKTKLENWEES